MTEQVTHTHTHTHVYIHTHMHIRSKREREKPFIGMKRSLPFWMELFSTGTIVDLERKKERETEDIRRA